MQAPITLLAMSEGQESTVLPPGGPNSLSRTLGLLGDEWGVLIMQRALRGTTRYSRFLGELPISNAVLTARLATLTHEGLLEHHVYQRNPTRAEYRLTERGRSVWPIHVVIWDWERFWVGGHDEELPVMTHVPCGGHFRPVLVCAACDEPVAARDIDVRWGPSGSWERSAPRGATRRRSRGGPGLFPESMGILGNRWSSAMLGAAFLGVRRFSGFQEALGAPPSVVAERLGSFTAQGVLAAECTSQRSDWMEYQLTDKGRAFFPQIMLMMAWGERWYRAPEGPAFLLRHEGCGQDFEPTLRCNQCHRRLRGHEVHPMHL